MKQIDISDTDFPRLQALAEPFVDSPATVVSRLLDHFLASQENRDKSRITLQEPTPLAYSVNNIPPLKHTKLMVASFAGHSSKKNTWDAFVQLALSTAFVAMSRSLAELRRVSGANLANGRKVDEGFKYLDDLGFSYQGVSAEDAIQIVVRCARGLNEAFQVEFVWRDKPDAYKPGERGIVELVPQ